MFPRKLAVACVVGLSHQGSVWLVMMVAVLLLVALLVHVSFQPYIHVSAATQFQTCILISSEQMTFHRERATEGFPFQ